jgi:two-component system phosphate regulon sensor histidine kinase PhoR
MAASRFRPIERVARLRTLLAMLFLGLSIPAGVLIWQGFTQLELQEFRRQQLIAEGLVQRIDTELAAAVAIENARPFSDFEFAQVDATRNLTQLSPLSSPMPASAFPGAIGYFQVDASGRVSTPLLPEAEDQELDLDSTDLQMRRAAQTRVATVLEANRLVPAAATGSDPSAEESTARMQRFRQNEARMQSEAEAGTEEARMQSEAETGGNRTERTAGRRAERVLEDEPDAPGQAAFDQLSALSFADSKGEPAASPSADEADSATGRQETRAVTVADLAGGDVEPLRFSLLDTGHLVLFRNAWQSGQRFIQGILVDPDAFVAATQRDAFMRSGLAPGTRLDVTVAENRLASLVHPGQSGRSDSDSLYAARLSPPLADIALSFSAGALPRGPGFSLLVWTTVALAGVLLGGFAFMYRFGTEQLRLAQQQQNFVSAVSHELKTPLTSIRMYGEMLKSGWASDAKKQTYYDFILAEGERLSRLIDNVLQLARLNRGGPSISPERTSVEALFGGLRPVLAGQAERAGFAIDFVLEPPAAAALVDVDHDALTQVFINLVDNAIKFANDAARKDIVVSARLLDAANVTLSVRDFGPGIPQNDMKRLFELFYRPDNELTRATGGTGLGLSWYRP